MSANLQNLMMVPAIPPALLAMVPADHDLPDYAPAFPRNLMEAHAWYPDFALNRPVAYHISEPIHTRSHLMTPFE